MGPREVIIFSSVLIAAVSGYCRHFSEVGRLNEAIAECESLITPFYALRLLKQMSNDTLTFEQFVENLHPFCKKASRTFTCLSKNVRVPEDCHDSEAMQSILNTHTMRWYVPNFLCENNAIRYLDLAVNDGPLCYANNDLHWECILQPKYQDIISDRAPASSRNVCSLLDVTVYCLSAYDNCENQNVRLHIGNLNEHLQSHFGCLES